MLNWMRSALTPKRPSADAGMAADPIAAARAFFNEQIARMPAIWPPERTNEDPMAGLVEVVEHELQVAGYLR